MNKKVLFTANLQSFIVKFLTPYLRWFKEQGWETWVAGRDDLTDRQIDIPYCDQLVDIPFTRNPFSRDVLRAYEDVKKLLEQNSFEIIHTHTPVGSVVTRAAARKNRGKNTRVIYTAHGFHFYNGAPFMNWALWYPVERFMSRYTDVLITINNEDFRRASKFAKCDVEYVPGVGIDLNKFNQPADSTAIRAKLGYSNEDIVILAVGDLIKRKNHQAIIKALPLLPENFKLVIVGAGLEADSLRALSEKNNVTERAQFLGFRRDVPALMKASDLLVFPSIHEGLPVAVMEAMASGLPVIATKIRGIDPDLINDGVSGLLLQNPSPQWVACRIMEIMNDPKRYETMSYIGKEKMNEFSIECVLPYVAKIYEHQEVQNNMQCSIRQ